MFVQSWISAKTPLLCWLLVIIANLVEWSTPVQAQVTAANPAQPPPLPPPSFQRSLTTKSYTLSSLGMFTTAQTWDEVRTLTGERLEPFVITPDHQAEITELSQPATILTQAELVAATDAPKIIRVMRQGRSPRLTRIVPMTINNYRDFNLVQ